MISQEPPPRPQEPKELLWKRCKTQPSWDLVFRLPSEAAVLGADLPITLVTISATK